MKMLNSKVDEDMITFDSRLEVNVKIHDNKLVDTLKNLHIKDNKGYFYPKRVA